MKLMLPLVHCHFVISAVAVTTALQLAVVTAGHAESLKFLQAEAIISVPHSGGVSAQAASNALGRLRRGTYPSLGAENLSASSVRVIDWRKARRTTGNISQRYLSNLNPCNAPAVKRLLRSARTATCEPNWEGAVTLTPNDKFYTSMYPANPTSAASIGLTTAWDKTTGSQNVLVGIIDTGIDYRHSDLSSNVWRNPGEIAANGKDDDANGYVDDVYGIDAYNNDSDPFDDQSHGTHVAGTIGAVGNDTKGVMGINWQVKMVSCKAFGSTGSGTLSAVLKCIAYLNRLKTQYGFNVVAYNNSYGGFPLTEAMGSAIETTRQAGIVFVAGAGNNGKNNDTTPFYPASYPHDNIIAVGAVDSSAKIATFSNFGPNTVDIFAPGVGILSTIPNNNWAFFSGTSMATPHVTGAVALLKAYRPEASYQGAVTAILNGSRSISSLTGLVKTGALLNVNGALEYTTLRAPPLQTPVPTGTAQPTSTPTPRPSATSTPRPTATATPKPSVTVTPQPTATSTPQPTPTATPKPSATPSAAIKISVTYPTQTTIQVACTLTQLDKPVQGAVMNLPVQGVNTWRSPTNSQGHAIFAPSLGKVASYTARCSAQVTDPATKTVMAVYSEIVTIKGTVR